MGGEFIKVMSTTRPINDLTKSELLNLIYQNLPSTTDHPCMCAACGDGENKNGYSFICDACNKANTDEDEQIKITRKHMCIFCAKRIPHEGACERCQPKEEPKCEI